MFDKIFKGNLPLFDNTPISSPFKTVEYQLSTIVEKIKDIDSLNDDELKEIIVRQYSTILNYDLFLSVPETRNAALELFTNKRFLKLFFDIVGLLELSESQIICINKLAYDYYSLADKDIEICEILMNISNIVNNILVIKLSASLGMYNARVLAMVSNSTFRVDKKVHRINTFLLKCGMQLSVQNIIDIYLIIFDSRFKDLFINTMLESIDSLSDDDKANAILVNNYNNISIALIKILDSMISRDIEQVLLNYVYSLQILASPKLRFGFKGSSAIPARIVTIIQNIEDQTGLIIP